MSRPPSVILAFVLALLLALWHGFYGLTIGLGSLGGLLSAVSLLFSGDGWWAFQSAWQSVLFGVVSIARLAAAATLLGGAVWFFLNKSRTPLLLGAVLGALAHGLQWLASTILAVVNWQINDDMFYWSLGDSWYPGFILDIMAEFAFLRLPVEILFSSATTLIGVVIAALILGGALAPASKTWLAREEPAEPDKPVAAPPEFDDEATIPEGDLPQVSENPDEEATEMASLAEIGELVAMAEDARKKKG